MTHHPLYAALGRNDEARRAAYRELSRYQLDSGMVDEIRSATNGNYCPGQFAVSGPGGCRIGTAGDARQIGAPEEVERVRLAELVRRGTTDKNRKNRSLSPICSELRRSRTDDGGLSRDTRRFILTIRLLRRVGVKAAAARSGQREGKQGFHGRISLDRKDICGGRSKDNRDCSGPCCRAGDEVLWVQSPFFGLPGC